MVFVSVVIKGWTIYPYTDWLFDCSSKIPVVPPHYAEVVYSCRLTCCGMWYGGAGLKMFLKALAKCSGTFTNIHFTTFFPATCVSVDYPTFLSDGISVHECHQEVFDGCFSFKIYLYPICFTSGFDTFTVLLCKALLCLLYSIFGVLIDS